MSKVKFNGSIYIVSAIAALSGLLFGFDSGIISGALLFIERDFILATGMREFIVSSILVGAMIGSFGGGRLADRLGRRRAMLFIASLFIIGTLILSFANNISMIIFGRILLGIAIGIGSYLAPLYIAETAPKRLRGALVSVNQLAITLGILLAYIVSFLFMNVEHSWRWMFLVGMLPAVLLGMGMIFLPESPRWLIKQGLREKAKSTLRYLRPHEDIDIEFNEIECVLNQKAHRINEIFSPSIRNVLFLGVFLGVLQQVTGINTIIYYAPTIFQITGFQDIGSAIFVTIGIGIINVVSTVFALFFVDRLGRRPLLFSGLIGMGVSLLCLSAAFHIDISSNSLRFFSIGCIFIYVISYAISLGLLLWLLVSEIFPLNVRSPAMSFAVFTSWLSNFIVSFTFLTLLDVIGPSGTFFLYAMMCMIGLLVSFYLVPETKGVSLETIESNIRARLPLRQIGLP